MLSESTSIDLELPAAVPLEGPDTGEELEDGMLADPGGGSAGWTGIGAKEFRVDDADRDRNGAPGYGGIFVLHRLPTENRDDP